MPKAKAHSGATKRFKKTATGKLKFHSPGRRHLASSKTRKQKRQLKRPLIAARGDQKRLLPSM